jgi:hypothetical protein
MAQVHLTDVDGREHWFPTVNAYQAFCDARKAAKAAPLPSDWMRVAPGTDAAIWRPWSRETGEL